MKQTHTHTGRKVCSKSIPGRLYTLNIWHKWSLKTVLDLQRLVLSVQFCFSARLKDKV